LGISIPEFSSLEYVSLLATEIKRHEAAFSLYVDYYGYSSFEEVGQAIEKFAEHYQGAFESVEDYVQHYYKESGLLKAFTDTGFDLFILIGVRSPMIGNALVIFFF
jgi:antirestriction protein